jgi:hypothetical protein
MSSKTNEEENGKDKDKDKYLDKGREITKALKKQNIS